MKTSGFTYIELIVVIIILGIIVAISIPSLASFYLSNNFDISSTMLLSSVRKAQQYAIDNKNDLSWGVCLTGSTLRLYGGSCLVPTIKDDYLLPPSVTISGLSDLSFSRFRGEPNAPAIITITSAAKNITININHLGGINAP